MDWVSEAACRTENPELFFPTGDAQFVAIAVMRAKQICRGCPVVTECLAYALDSEQRAGVWGGLSETERRHSRSRQRSQAITNRHLATWDRNLK